MNQRLLFVASAVARFVLVVVAFGLAVGSIGLVSVRGFCPEVGGDAAALAAGEATSAVVLATIVEEPAPEVDPNSPAPDEQGPDDTATQPPPAEEAPTEGDGGGACPGGVQRCLPPLWSSVLVLGETACHDQAPARLRSTVVPSFVGATVLLAGAWWLRPSRLHADRDDEATTGSR